MLLYHLWIFDKRIKLDRNDPKLDDRGVNRIVS